MLPRLCGPPLRNGMKFCHKILETLSYHMVKTRSLYLMWAPISKGEVMDMTDRQKDGQTESP